MTTTHYHTVELRARISEDLAQETEYLPYINAKRKEMRDTMKQCMRDKFTYTEEEAAHFLDDHLCFKEESLDEFLALYLYASVHVECRRDCPYPEHVFESCPEQYDIRIFEDDGRRVPSYDALQIGDPQ